MAISDKSKKILWAAAAGQCSFEGCSARLFDNGVLGKEFTIGEMAHIEGERLGSNRHNPAQPEEEKDHYTNLILLCPTHHTLIDKKENEETYTVDVLKKMKSEHELRITNSCTVNDPCLKEIAVTISSFLMDSKAIWKLYGPESDLAHRNPHDENIHALWVTQRLSVIVPNNRNIAKLLDQHRGLFSSAEQQQIISLFLLHAQSYEEWVHGTLPYIAVLRFPTEFEIMIGEVINASI